MPYTVYRPDGNTADEFETYVRLLRQSGVDIGRLPRMPDPVTGKKWLYVWSDQANAEVFRREIAEQTASNLWRVEEVTAAPSEGPLGPLIVRMLRQHGQFVFTLSLLGRHIVRTASLNAQGVWSMSIPSTTINELRSERRDFFPSLVRTIMPALTGLTTDQLAEIGYAVIDADTNQWEYYSAPAALTPTPAAA